MTSVVCTMIPSDIPNTVLNATLRGCAMLFFRMSSMSGPGENWPAAIARANVRISGSEISTAVSHRLLGCFSEMLTQLFEAVGIDPVDTRVVQNVPHRRIVRRRPQSQLFSFGMRFFNE